MLSKAIKECVIMKKYYPQKHFCILLFGTVLIILLSSCNSKNNGSYFSSADNDAEFIKLFPQDNPYKHINSVRQYVEENCTNLSPDDLLIVQNTKPRIVNNAEKMEYSFYWVLPDGKGIVEVVTTPPPQCSPFLLNVGKNIYYP